MEHSSNTRNHRSSGGHYKKKHFETNGKYWQQKDGTPMGSPISSNHTEIFLQNLESKFFPNIVENRYMHYKTR
jgi:hypothetical protein